MSTLEKQQTPTLKEIREKRKQLLGKKAELEKKAAEEKKRKEKQATSAALTQELNSKLETYNTTYAVISEAEYNTFRETGDISSYRLGLIAEKVKNNEKLDPAEKEIEENKRDQIKTLIAEKEEKKIEIQNEPEKTELVKHSDPISDEVFENFKKTQKDGARGEIDDSIIDAIVEKNLKGSWLSPRELEIQKNYGREVAERYKERKSGKQSTTEKKKEEASPEFSADVRKKFEDNFGFNPYADLPGFKDLSKGGQEAVYKNFGQIQVGLIQKKAEDFFWDMQKSAGTMAKIGNNLRKTYLIEKNKEQARKALRNEGANAYKQYSTAIVENIRMTGLTVKFEGTKAQVQYAHDLEGLSVEERDIVNRFNKRATQFGDIPREWAFEDAGRMEKFVSGEFDTMNQKASYESAKESYGNAREKLAGVLKRKFNNDETKMNAYLRGIDNNIAFNQMIAQDPKAMEALNFFDKEVVGVVKQGAKGMKKAWIPGLSFGAGWLARSGAATAGVANYGMLFIAPAIASLRGIVKGRENARTTLKNARLGIEEAPTQKGWYNKIISKITNPTLVGMRTEEDVKKDLLAKFQSATETRKTIGKDKTEVEKEVGMTKKLENAVNALEKTQNEIGKAKELLATETNDANKKILEEDILRLRNIYATRQDAVSHRLEQIETKQQEGMIDFGAQNEQFINRYNLSNATSRAYALLIASPYGELKESEKRERADGKVDADIFMERFGKAYEARLKAEGVKFSKAKKELVKQGAYKAFVTSLTFAGLGFAGRSLYDLFHGAPEETQAILKDAIKDRVETNTATNTLDTERLERPEITPMKPLAWHEEAAERTVIPPSGADVTLRPTLTENFSIKLGEGGVPKNLETAFHAIAVDHMNIPEGATFDEEMGAKSLNVAANLVKLSEGQNVGGASAKAFEAAAHFDPTTHVLEIKDHDAFNTVLKTLNTHANINWKMGVLQKGAVGDLDNIKSWTKIIHADGFKPETGIVGHDEIDAKHITDFSKSELVGKARAIHHAPLTGGKASVLSNQNTSGGFVPKQGTDPFTPSSQNNNGNFVPKQGTNPFSTSTPDATPNTAADPADFTPKKATNPFKNDTIQQGGDGGQTAPEQQDTNIQKAATPDKTQTGAPEQTAPQDSVPASSPVHEVTGVDQEVVSSLTPEAQTENIISKIFETDEDPAHLETWEAVKGQEMGELLNATRKDFAGVENEEYMVKLWKYVNKLNLMSFEKPLSNNETVEHYIFRAGQSFAEKQNESLDVVLAESAQFGNQELVSMPDEIKNAAEKMGFKISIEGRNVTDNASLNIHVDCDPLNGGQGVKGVDEFAFDKNSFTLIRNADLESSYTVSNNSIGIDERQWKIFNTDGTLNEAASYKKLDEITKLPGHEAFVHDPVQNLNYKVIDKTAYKFTKKGVTRILFFKDGTRAEENVL